MSFIIAMAGKGGTGKTTVAGMLLRYLLEHGKKPVLAVDADANSNLNEVLGVEVESSVGAAREEMKKGGGMVDMSKDQLIEMRINQCLVEADGFDLIAMGQPEGPGCYCAANNLVAHFMDVLAKNYPYILMDNEAGMEHMSRLTTNKVDLLVLVSDPSWRSIQAVRRLKDLAQALKVVVGRAVLIVNRVTNGLSERTTGGNCHPGPGTGRFDPRGSAVGRVRQPGPSHFYPASRFPSIKRGLRHLRPVVYLSSIPTILAGVIFCLTGCPDNYYFHNVYTSAGSTKVKMPAIPEKLRRELPWRLKFPNRSILARSKQ